MVDATPEEWRPVPYPEYADFYRISSRGRLLSVRSGKILRLYPNRKGRLTRSISVKSKKWLIYVHTAVALAFLGPRPDGMMICHRDGNVQNNNVLNLYFGTASDNMQDRSRHGRDHNKSKTHCPRGHEYTPENTYISKEGYRRCRQCGRERKRDAPPLTPEKREAQQEYMRKYRQENKWRFDIYEETARQKRHQKRTEAA